MPRPELLLPLPVTYATLAAHAGSDGEDPWLGRDKLLHLGAAAGIAAAGYGAASLLTGEGARRVAVGVSVGVMAGIGKELYDLRGEGNASWRDLIWDGVGAAAGALAALAVDRLIRWVGASPPATGR